MKKILILANDVTTIVQFRKELIKALVDAGNQVLVSVPDHPRNAEIEELGAKIVESKASRHGKNPLQDIALLMNYRKLIKLHKPDFVLTYTVKPNAYGGMACGQMKVPYAANVTGLGVIENKGLLQKIMLTLYKAGCKKAKCVFFQNESNLKFFKEHKVVGDNVHLLPGSGVNVDRFSYLEYPEDERVNILFIGRIIRDKGVYELAEAAKQYLDNENVHFTILGDVEYGSENPFVELENVSCMGYNNDIVPFLKEAHAVILPSYHEGMANVLLEGASSGRPILASTIPGCRESFDEGKTGFGFEVKNADSLKCAIDKFLSLSHDEKCQMGKMGREKMEKQFDRKIVINEYFKIING